jgi:tetratricopeptide (TPR) repeat protein
VARSWVQDARPQRGALCCKRRVRRSRDRNLEEQPTSNLETYGLYLRAKELITNAIVGNVGDSRASLTDAIKLLEEATERDSKFALAYCLIVKADDWLYLGKFDLAERRAHGDAAVRQALLIERDLPEVYLAAASHSYICYRDYKVAQVQIDLAKQALPNNADAFALTGYLDRRQGHWSESTKSLEKASDLDPRNPEILKQLMNSYGMLHQFEIANKS